MKLQVLLLLVSHSFVLIRTAAIIQENKIDDTDDDGDTDIDNKKCPPWDKWQASKCLWPTQQFSSLPKACTSLPKKPAIPAVVTQFIQSKQLELYSLVQNLFALRGAQSTCGYCSRKIRCRQRRGGQWQRGCQFAQAQIVNEECEGDKPCEIKPILGACPPPVPLPPRRRRPRTPESGNDLMNVRLQNIAQNGLGDQNLEIEADKNATQGPSLWHCARNKDGSKCLCCCGWYLPDASSGKCVNIRKDDTEDQTGAEQTWNWSGLMDLDLQSAFDADTAIGDQITEQIEAPPMEIAPAEETENQLPMPIPSPPAFEQLEATAHQLAAPVTDATSDKKPDKKATSDKEPDKKATSDKKADKKTLHEENEI